MLSLLKDRTYIRYWLAVVVSFLGDGITRTAVIFLVATLTDDPFAVGLAIFAQMLPSAVLGVFIGPLLDRWPKRWLMVCADLYRMVLVLLMMGAQHSPSVLIGLVVLQGIGTAFFEPARIASVPQLVGEQRIPQAVALFQATVSTINLAAPSAAGLLLAWNSTSAIFLLDAASYLVSAGLLISLVTLESSEGKTAAEPYLTALTNGVRSMYSLPAIRFLLLLLMPVMFAGGMFLTNLKALLLQDFHVPAIHYGMLEGVYGAVAILGAFIGPTLLKKWGADRMLMASAGLFGTVMLAAMPVNPLYLQWGLPVVYTWCIAAGLFHALINLPLASLFMLRAPAHLRGRGFALFQSTVTIWLIGGVLFGGWLANEAGIVSSIVGAGGLLLATSIAYSLLQRRNTRSVQPTSSS